MTQHFRVFAPQADVCMRSFKATSIRLKCAMQRDMRVGDDSGMGEAETGGFLKYCIDPAGELKDRVLPPPTFCTRSFDDEVCRPQLKDKR